MRKRVALFLALVIGCSGSKERSSASSSANEQASAAASTPPGARASSAAQSEAQAADEAAVRALVERWLAAQNSGDFAAYEPLYAPRFQGVKRTESRTRTLDREGWMKDRARMFRSPMRVAASALEITTHTTVAEVRFVQRWASERYSDEGPKRLGLVRTGEEWKIATEEMLAARRLGELDAALTIGTFIAFKSNLGPLAILAEARDEDAEGSPMLLANEEQFIVGQRASSRAPEAFTALVGREVRVIERARVCTGVVEQATIAALVVPHMGEVMIWDGETPEGRTAPLSPERVAEEVLALASHRNYALAIRTACTDPVAVTLSTSSDIVSMVPREPSIAERTSLHRAFERTRSFAGREREYSSFYSDLDPDFPAPPAQRGAWRDASSVVVFEGADRTFATVVQNAEGCGGFDVSAWSGFSLENTRASEIIASPADFGDYVSVIAIFDAEGDGTFEAVIRRGLGDFGLVRFSPDAGLLRVVDVDFLDCGC